MMKFQRVIACAETHTTGETFRTGASDIPLSTAAQASEIAYFSRKTLFYEKSMFGLAPNMQKRGYLSAELSSSSALILRR